MKFRVAGGPGGKAGIEVAGRRYEVGDEVEMTQKDAEWLVEQGYLALGIKGQVATPLPSKTADEAPIAEGDE